ncbi:MAG: DUF502 domain-containing protein [Holophagaceae bacterium]|uniref:DUF502 domain-containing protein n=1 Tax=Candidatus Geothrix skivensis TaxID=2954439 RepID=A0A9D7SK08_9BACT|nr:DUF502 domain-containing protein [Candidatus Geothrix skivensis]
MIKQALQKVLGTWLAGLLALLPLLLTLSLLAWVVNLSHIYLGPNSPAGRFFSLFGQPFANHPVLEYLAGSVVLVLVIYPLGLAVQSSLKKPLAALVDRTVRRIPVVGSLYSLADRFVGLLDKKQDADIAAMSPVWCFFGGDGVAVLALLPNPVPIQLEGRPYLAVLVPTAPVPIGGGLLYLPAEWVRPAQIGVDTLTSVYLSMGIVAPLPLLKDGRSSPSPE